MRSHKNLCINFADSHDYLTHSFGYQKGCPMTHLPHDLRIRFPAVQIESWWRLAFLCRQKKVLVSTASSIDFNRIYFHSH